MSQRLNETSEPRRVSSDMSLRWWGLVGGGSLVSGYSKLDFQVAGFTGLRHEFQSYVLDPSDKILKFCKFLSISLWVLSTVNLKLLLLFRVA